MPSEDAGSPALADLLQMETLDKEYEGSRAQGKKARAQGKKALLYPSLYWGLPPTITTPTQGSEFLKYWEALMSVACLWVGVVVPYTLGFAKVYIKSGEQCLFLQEPGDQISAFFLWSRYIDILVDTMFLMDICMTFVTARWELRNDPMPHWVLIDDIADLRKAYLSSTFLLDFVAWLPVQYLDCAKFLDTSYLKAFAMLRLLKLLRLKRLTDVIGRLQERYPKSVYFFASIQLFLYFFLGAHWTACSFFAIGYGVADPEGDEYARYLYERGWVYQTGVLDENGLPVEYADPWVAAMYWAVTTMSTIGYGDIFPVTAPERILGMLLMVMGCAFFAWITGKITHIMTEKSPSEERFDSTMEEVETFMKARMMPTSLQERIQDYYKVKYPNKSIFDEQELIENIDSPSLKRGIVNHLYKDVVSSVPIFSMCNDEVKLDLCFRLKSVYRMSDRQITTAGDEPEALYAIRFGTVVAHTSLGTTVTFQQGELFGEMAMLGLTKDGKRCRSAKALSVCELCELSRRDFLELLQKYSSFLSLIRMSTKIHLAGMREALSVCVDSLSLHFREHLEKMDWEGIADEIKTNLRSQVIRAESSKFSQERILSLQAKSGRQVLYTNFYFQISQLSGDLSFATAKYGKAIIVMAQEGLRDMKGMIIPGSNTQNDSEIFGWVPSKPDGSCGKDVRVDIHNQVHLPVLHRAYKGDPKEDLDVNRNEIHLNDLPAFRVAVMMVNRNDLARTSDGELAAEVVPVHETGVSSLKSKTFPSARTMWMGELPFSRAIQSRDIAPDVLWPYADAENQREGLTRKNVNNKGITIELRHVDDPNKKAVLECSVRVMRKPLLPVWGRVISTVVANGSSAFFERKIQTILDNVCEETEHFQSAIRDKRVAMFPNFSNAQSKSAGKNSRPDLAREEALKREFAEIFRARGGSDEASAIQDMRRALELVSTRIMDQGAHFQVQAQRIKKLRSSIAELHCSMASQVASFSNHAESEEATTNIRQRQIANEEIFRPDPRMMSAESLDMRALASFNGTPGRSGMA